MSMELMKSPPFLQYYSTALQHLAT